MPSLRTRIIAQKNRLKAWARSAPPSIDSSRSAAARDAITADLWAYGIGAAVLIALSGDFIAAMPGPARLVLAVGLTLSLLMVHWGLAAKTRGMRAILVTLPILAGLYLITHLDLFIGQAVVDLEANDGRCAAIQRDMLSAHRRMADGPDVYQALGCKPQGTGIIRVPPTDRERAAGHPLLDGGYPDR